MHVLVIGSGGREHTLTWGISRSSLKPRITCIPGNAGMSRIAKCVNINIKDHTAISNFCLSNDVDLAVVGPEDPLVAGIADVLLADGISVFGPTSSAAIVEGSKIFSKEFCECHNIPTAAFRIFDDPAKAHKYIEMMESETCVVKADGLAEGKGAIVCDDLIDAHTAVDTCLLERKFGESGAKIVIEDRLVGFETTLLALIAGKEYRVFPYSQDHKRAKDGDRGLNTGGMGVFAPTPKVSTELNKKIISEIVEPTLTGLVDEGIEYIGCLYFGIMVTEDGPQLIEYNCRFGDPEIQALMPLMEGDFLETLVACSKKKLGDIKLRATGKKSLSVILASNGYPESYKKGVDITDDLKVLEENPDLLVFHAGTRIENGRILTSGGRVIAVTSVADDFGTCRERVYGAIRSRPFNGLFYRSDIGRELVPV